jgi:hypothetical protein
VVAVAWPLPFNVALVHLHNVVAVVLWLLLRRSGPALRRPSAFDTSLVALIALVAAFILAGGADSIVTMAGGWEARATGSSFDDFVAGAAPGVRGPLALRLVLSFAFMQSVHYGVWLRLVPDDLRARAAPRPFAASWRSLRADLGLWPLVAFTLLALGVAAWGTVDLFAARMGYLRLAAFHGFLELGALAFLTVDRPAR